MGYLLDADWIIDVLGGRRGARDILSGLASEGLAVSWITIAEVYEGAMAAADPESALEVFRRYLHSFRILDLNDPIAERFARIRSDLRRRGSLIPDLDILLGATALHYDLTVLTRNLRHLSRIPGISLYH